MQYRTTPISSTLPSPLEMLTGRRPHSTLPQLPSSIGKNMETSRIWQELLREGNPTTLPQEPTWIWILDNQFFVKEVSGNIWENCYCWPTSSWAWLLLGWDFQTIPYWEGPGQWSNPGLYLLISSFRLKQNQGTLKEKPTHVLLTPSTSWMNTQCCLLHQWWVWPHQQQLIEAAKSVKQPILSFPQRHPSLLWVESTSSVPPTPRHSTRSSKGVPLDRYTPIQETDGIQWMFCVCRICSESVGLLVSSVLQYGLVKHGTMWKNSSPLVYSKFYL